MENNNNELMQQRTRRPKVNDSTPSVEDIAAQVGGQIGAQIAAALDQHNTIRQQELSNSTAAAIEINKQVQEKAAKQLSFNRRIVDDLNHRRNCRMYSIPLIYKEFQPSFVVSINGNTIKVPADGKERLIHNLYINIIEKRLRYLDEKINAMNNSSRGDIQEIKHF